MIKILKALGKGFGMVFGVMGVLGFTIASLVYLLKTIAGFFQIDPGWLVVGGVLFIVAIMFSWMYYQDDNQ